MSYPNGYRVMYSNVPVQALGLKLVFEVSFIIGWTNEGKPTVLWMRRIHVNALSESGAYHNVYADSLNQWPEDALELLADGIIGQYMKGHYENTFIWTVEIPKLDEKPKE